jgi:hypothetical protein
MLPHAASHASVSRSDRQVRAADESLRNISETYKSLGIWEDTIVPSPRHNYHNQNSGLTEIYLRFAIPLRILMRSR